jgi:16S rRNA (cytosine967-C5)-methyltransferase
MKQGGRLQAAIEILGDIDAHHRPAREATKDWMNAHRFAGARDRAAIGNLVFDALRWRASGAWAMDSEAPRALVLATWVFHWSHSLADLDAALADDRHAPEPISESERAALGANDLSSAPDWVRADVPDWASEHLEANFDDQWVTEGAALAARATLDLRVNPLKAGREKVLKSLSAFGARACAIANNGIRIAPGAAEDRPANVTSEAGYRKGWFEIQDEGSQIAAELVFARPGEQILDFCAGGGGKTLAMAADMANRGQVMAFDRDRHRLAGIHERLKRAGTRNVQVLAPEMAALEGLAGKMDRVVVDAPCTGSGVWRRRPDAKWRVTPQALEARMGEQDRALAQASLYVRKGGFLAYITCSLFPQENEARVYHFLAEQSAFELVSAAEVWQDLYGFDKPQPWSSDQMSITLTPASTGTDGFYFAVMVNNEG